MKLAIIFLAIFVAYSHQQYRHQMMFGRPWLSPYPHRAPYFNDYVANRYNRPIEDDLLVGRHYPINVLTREEIPQPNYDFQHEIQSTKEETEFPDNMARTKGFFSSAFKRPLSFNQQQNARFFFNLGGRSSIGNPLLKTVTFSLTSTCTVISLLTCIPAVYLPVPVVGCNRKRSIDVFNDQSEDQFPIGPTEIQQVEPTEQPTSTLERVARQATGAIASSKEENAVIETNKDLPIDQLSRRRRFYYLWQSFATGTTQTVWVTTPSTKTITLIPTNVADGATSAFPCLPAGYSLC